MQRTLNPYAPDLLNGVMPDSPPGCLDVYHEYPFNVTLVASQVLDGQVRSVDTDADFILRAIVYTSTGNFSVRFADANSFYISDQKILSTCLSTDGGRPYVVFPELVYPRGGGILIDLTERSALANTIQLVFRGVKRYTGR